MDNNNLERIKEQVLSVLSHPEAEDGLYLRNFTHLHEEDERPAVLAKEEDLLEALTALISEGKVKLDESSEEVVFALYA